MLKVEGHFEAFHSADTFELDWNNMSLVASLMPSRPTRKGLVNRVASSSLWNAMIAWCMLASLCSVFSSTVLKCCCFFKTNLEFSHNYLKVTNFCGY